MDTTGMEIRFVSTIKLWQAMRDGYCGCFECIRKTPIGFGKTREEAAADLIEKELSLVD